MGQITMYRLMLYYLIFLVVWASVLSFLTILPFNGASIALQAIYLTFICWIGNKLFAGLFKVSANPESALISGLILSLIMGPYNLISSLIPLTLVALFAMASKYLIVIQKKHIFNPAAFGALASGLILHHGASWWVGNIYTLPVVALGGLLILKKIRRFQLVAAFLVPALLLSVFSEPLIFFSLVMLIEPSTSPFSSKAQIVYGILIALIFNLFGKLPYFIPFPLETSLLIGNIFSYIVSKNFRQVLKLKEKRKESSDVYSFIFEPMKKFDYKSGQYLQWMLPHTKPDSRGVRRYFTVASSPTEGFIMLASKFYERVSTFKKALLNMKPQDEIIISDLQGEFTLPSDKNKKLCFIAGGIGITPFRSMAKFMVDTKEIRDIVLLYSNKTKEDIEFRDIFEKALEFGWRTIYVNTDTDGLIDANMIREKLPDWGQRHFFVSGPEPMVESFEKMLYEMGLSEGEVKRDYFPGYEYN